MLKYKTFNNAMGIEYPIQRSSITHPRHLPVFPFSVGLFSFLFCTSAWMWGSYCKNLLWLMLVLSGLAITAQDQTIPIAQNILDQQGVPLVIPNPLEFLEEGFPLPDSTFFFFFCLFFLFLFALFSSLHHVLFIVDLFL